MFVAAFDDRKVLPGYFYHFISHTIRFCDLNFITPINSAGRLSSEFNLDNEFQLNLLNPRELPGYLYSQKLFDDIFVNLSTNPARFERSCFLRWFALNAATSHLNNDDFVCLLDTDFLLAISPSSLLALCTQTSFGENIDFIAEWKPHTELVSIGPEITILRKSTLFNFCRFIITSYFSSSNREYLRREYFDRIGNGLTGGICDMRALASFVRQSPSNVVNIRELPNVELVDNLNNLARVSSRFGSWHFDLNQNRSYIHIDGRDKKLVGVHFQGHAKYLIALAVKLKFFLSSNDCAKYSLYSDAFHWSQFVKRFIYKLRIVVFRFLGYKGILRDFF